MISHSISNHDAFNLTCRKGYELVSWHKGDESMGFKGAYKSNVLTVHGFQNDCTSVHISGAKFWGIIGYEDQVKHADIALEEIKRWMWYANKNVAICTIHIYKNNSGYNQNLVKEMKARGFQCVCETPSSRELGKTKFVFLYVNECFNVGYNIKTDFTVDPWYQERMKKEQNK